MMYFIFALLVLICILTVVCYALLVIASEEEKRAERMYRAWKERLKDDMENNGEPIDSDYNIGINHAMCVIETMSKWIDYDAIDYRNDRLHDKSEEFLNGVIYMAQRIEEAPSIDIVRCKECKFWIGHISDDDGFDEGLDECRWRDSEAPDADDFCSYGERKTNAD